MVLPALNEVHLEPVYRNLEEAWYSSWYSRTRLLWKYLQHLVYGIVGAGISLLPITNRHLALRWSTLEYDDTLDNGTGHSSQQRCCKKVIACVCIKQQTK